MKLIDRYLGLEWAKWFALSMFFLFAVLFLQVSDDPDFARSLLEQEGRGERVGLDFGIPGMGFACFLFCCDCDHLFSFEESGIVSLAGFGFLFIRTKQTLSFMPGRSCLCYVGKP